MQCFNKYYLEVKWPQIFKLILIYCVVLNLVKDVSASRIVTNGCKYKSVRIIVYEQIGMCLSMVPGAKYGLNYYVFGEVGYFSNLVVSLASVKFYLVC